MRRVAVVVAVAALYRHHKWLVRVLMIAFVCEAIWFLFIWILSFPRLVVFDSACLLANLEDVKWCFLAVAYVSTDLPFRLRKYTLLLNG
jgi:hypothetical protein